MHIASLTLERPNSGRNNKLSTKLKSICNYEYLNLKLLFYNGPDNIMTRIEASTDKVSHREIHLGLGIKYYIIS